MDYVFLYLIIIGGVSAGVGISTALFFAVDYLARRYAYMKLTEQEKELFGMKYMSSEDVWWSKPVKIAVLLLISVPINILII